MPASVTRKPERIRSLCERLCAILPAAAEATRMPMVAGVRISPVSTAL